MKSKKLLKAVMTSYLPIVGAVCFFILLTFQPHTELSDSTSGIGDLPGTGMADIVIILFYLFSAVYFLRQMRQKDHFIYAMPFENETVYLTYWKAGVRGILAVRLIVYISGWLQLSEVGDFAWEFFFPVFAGGVLDVFMFSATMAVGIRKKKFWSGIAELILSLITLRYMLIWLDSVLVGFGRASAFNPGAFLHNLITFYKNPMEVNAASVLIKKGQTGFTQGSYWMCYVLLTVLLLAGTAFLAKKGKDYAGQGIDGSIQKNYRKRFFVPSFIVASIAVLYIYPFITTLGTYHNTNKIQREKAHEISGDYGEYEDFEIITEHDLGSQPLDVYNDYAGFRCNVAAQYKQQESFLFILLMAVLILGFLAGMGMFIVCRTSFGGEVNG